jgi:hypothetical protein
MRRRHNRYMLDSMAKHALERTPPRTGLYASWMMAGVAELIVPLRVTHTDG